MISIIKPYILAVIFFLITACSDSEDESVYQGITETIIDSLDSYGNPVVTIISIDADDWNNQISPPIVYDTTYLPPPIAVEIGPAFPNPASDTTFIKIVLSESKVINIDIKDESGNIVKNVFDDTLQAGHWFISWDLSNENGKKVSNGIYRCFYDWEFYSYDDSSYHNISGYGDIQVQ